MLPFSMDQKPSEAVAELHAPAHWRCVDLVSDLHLQATELATFDGFRNLLMQPPAERADALFILGDLFEVWVGDDALDGVTADEEARTPGDRPSGGTGSALKERRFWRRCADLLLTYSRHTPVYFMRGNRDFLMGPAGLARCGMRLLADPAVLVLHGQRYLLSHGDALCLDDIDYMRFRAVVRQPAWQAEFLARPLGDREIFARDLRRQSEARKASSTSDPALWADADPTAVRQALTQQGCSILVHGHTHRPADHDLGEGLSRVVLSDWDLAARPPRAEVLRIGANGPERRPLPRSSVD